MTEFPSQTETDAVRIARDIAASPMPDVAGVRPLTPVPVPPYFAGDTGYALPKADIGTTSEPNIISSLFGKGVSQAALAPPSSSDIAPSAEKPAPPVANIPLPPERPIDVPVPTPAAAAPSAQPFTTGSVAPIVPSDRFDPRFKTETVGQTPSTAMTPNAARMLEATGRFEARGDQSNISIDKGGSKSYGLLGLNSGSRAGDWNSSAGNFARAYGQPLGITARPGTPEFDAQWKAAATNNPEGLRAAQQDWYYNNIYKPTVSNVAKTGVPMQSASDPRVQSYFADRQVQYGPASTTNHAGRVQAAWNASGGNVNRFLENMRNTDMANLPNDFKTYLGEHPSHITGLRNRAYSRWASSMDFADGGSVDRALDVARKHRADGGDAGDDVPGYDVPGVGYIPRETSETPLKIIQKIAENIVQPFLLPGDVYAGKFDTKPSVPGQWSDEDEARAQLNEKALIERAADLATNISGGTYALGPVVKNAAGMGVKTAPTRGILATPNLRQMPTQNEIAIAQKEPHLIQDASGQNVARRAMDPNLYHGISNIKLPKPISEMSSVVEPAEKVIQEKVTSPAKLQNGYLLPLIGDRTAAGGNLVKIGEQKLSEPVVLQGGAGFIPQNVAEKAAWASDPSPITNLSKRVAGQSELGKPIYGTYTSMGPQSGDFSHHVSDSLSEMLKQSERSKNSDKIFDQAMKAPTKDFNKERLTDWPGVNSSDLKEYLRDAPGQIRSKFAKLMDSRKFQDRGFPSVAEARFATTDPRLLNEQTGASGLAIAKMDPFGKSFVSPKQHLTYKTNLAGEYVGGLPVSVPKEIMYPDVVEALSKYRESLPGYKPTIDYLMMRTPKGFPVFQETNQKWLDQLSKYLESKGYRFAKGGKVEEFGTDAASDAVNVAKQQAGRRH